MFPVPHSGKLQKRRHRHCETDAHVGFPKTWRTNCFLCKQLLCRSGLTGENGTAQGIVKSKTYFNVMDHVIESHL